VDSQRGAAERGGPSPDPPATGIPGSCEIQQDSLSLLDCLPAAQRAAVRGRVIDGRGYEDIARQLGCSETAVLELIGRGLRTLRVLAGHRP
jgi:DNA-directed RNA polymerase specialized sigma24 family protein